MQEGERLLRPAAPTEDPSVSIAAVNSYIAQLNERIPRVQKGQQSTAMTLLLQ